MTEQTPVLQHECEHRHSLYLKDKEQLIAMISSLADSLRRENEQLYRGVKDSFVILVESLKAERGELSLSAKEELKQTIADIIYTQLGKLGDNRQYDQIYKSKLFSIMGSQDFLEREKNRIRNLLENEFGLLTPVSSRGLLERIGTAMQMFLSLVGAGALVMGAYVVIKVDINTLSIRQDEDVRAHKAMEDNLTKLEKRVGVSENRLNGVETRFTFLDQRLVPVYRLCDKDPRCK